MEHYTPRWNRTVRQCVVTTCTTRKVKVSNCKLLSVTAIQQVLKDNCHIDNGQCASGVLLCQHHYNQVYRSIPGNHEKIQHKKCSVCQSLLNNMEPCHCTNPQLVKQQIKESHDLELDLNEDSIICRSCYKSFANIISNPLSLDINLQMLIAGMKRDEELVTLTGLDSCVQYSLIHTTRVVANSLLHNEALLLSEAYQQLTTTLQRVLTNTPVSYTHLTLPTIYSV